MTVKSEPAWVQPIMDFFGPAFEFMANNMTLATDAMVFRIKNDYLRRIAILLAPINFIAMCVFWVLNLVGLIGLGIVLLGPAIIMLLLIYFCQCWDEPPPFND